MITDISELKIAEINMQKMLHELEYSNTELERFASICSHDLKEPLRTIFSYLQLLKTDKENIISTESKEFIKFIESDSIKMKNLIENILFYSQIGKRDENKSTMDLNQTLNEAINLLSGLIISENVNIQKEGNAKIYANHESILRAFQNIISNAIKFNNKQNKIVTIKITSLESKVIIGIGDNGIGIEPEYWDQVFVIFKRLHPDDKYQGSGMGLAICKKIIENNNGTINIESSIDVGTQVIVTFPAITY
jgi:light-regulated signal transduction histidine kinase (bacteriophytochrome)